MADVALCHSVYGLRPAVLVAADRLRSAGHRVVAPDLYAGSVADTVEEGFALADRIGWAAIMRRAADAVCHLTADAILAGLSMGVVVVGELLRTRPAAAGLVLLHGTGADPTTVRAGLPVQLHIAEPDGYFPPHDVAAWEEAMTEAGAAVEVHRYPGAGHLFTDPDTPDGDGAAADLAWSRVIPFLNRL